MDAQTAVTSNSNTLEQADPDDPGETENIWSVSTQHGLGETFLNTGEVKPVANAFLEERHCSA